VKALQIDAPRRASIVDRPEPEPAAGEVLIRVARAGLCGTDLGTYLGKNPLVTYPRVIGHEIAGVIEWVGRDVPDVWRPGMRVTLSPYRNCGRCAACRVGRPNACRENQTLGVQRDGALAELAVVPHARLVASKGLSLDALALVEPFAIGLHAVRRGRITADDMVLVIGCGAVGLGVVAMAATRGARILAVDLDAGKLALARRMGARETLDGRSPQIAEDIRALTAGDGPDVVVEAVGSPVTYRQAVDWVAACGRVVYLGWTKEAVTFEAHQIVLKELDVLGARNATDELEEVVALFEQGRIDPLLLVTHRVPLDEAPAAFEVWAESPATVGKVLVELEEMNAAPVRARLDADFDRFLRHCSRYRTIASKTCPRGVVRFRTVEEAQQARARHIPLQAD
jgi:threonine dehydrogenase-like Zn-dependent dehydrogenase